MARSNILARTPQNLEVLGITLRQPVTILQYVRIVERNAAAGIGDDLFDLLMEVGAVDIELQGHSVVFELWNVPDQDQVRDALSIIRAFATPMKVETIRRRYVRPETL